MSRRFSLSIAILGLGLVLGWAGRELWNRADLFAQPPAGLSTNRLQSERTGRVTTDLSIPPLGSQPLMGLEDFTPDERVNIMVYENCNRSVVNISTQSIRPDSFLLATAVKGSGSGSVLDTDGHILTNYHVVEGARDVTVTLFNGEIYGAEWVYEDADNDIAVLQIKAPREFLIPIVLGDSANLRVGQRIFAIGNPYGLKRTMSTGIISSLDRQLPSRNERTMKSIIQIDAALNQGNSGGPLLNSRGQLIGMNTAIATSTGDNAGIGFSIPVNTIKRIVPQLIRDGRVVRPTIGITQVYETEKGLQVVRVTPSGPADRAGIKGYGFMRQQIRRGFDQFFIDRSSADLIVAVDDHPVKTADDLLTIIENKRAGDLVRVSIVRKGRQETIPVTLGSDEIVSSEK